MKKLIFAFLISIFISTNLFAKEKLVLGITGVALKDDISTLIKLKNYLAKNSGFSIDLKFAKSYSIMESFLKNGSVDIAYICGATYVNLLDTYKVELLAIPVSHGKRTYSSLLISKSDSNFNKLSDFKNQLFAMSDPDSNSGALVPKYNLIKQGYSIDGFFKNIIYTYDHGESIEAVLNGFVAGASVDSLVYESYFKRYPSKKKLIKIVEDFSGYPIPPFVILKKVDNSIKIKLKKVLLSMNNDKTGKNILDSLAIEYFSKPDNISYKKIIDIKKIVDNEK